MKALLRPLAVLVFAGLSVFALTARATITDVYWNFSMGTGDPSHVTTNVSGGLMTSFNFDALYTPAFDTVASSSGYSGVNGGSSGFHNASVEVNNVAGPVTLANLGTATYFEFTLAPDPGLQLVATDFELGTRSRTGFGPQTITVVASTDGFASFTTLGSTAVAANSAWNLASIPSFSYTAPIDAPSPSGSTVRTAWVVSLASPTGASTT